MSRFGSVTQRKVLKEKIVQQYELIFRSQDEDERFSNPIFWDEFFLLKCNISALETEIHRITAEQFQDSDCLLHQNIRRIVTNALLAVERESPVSQTNALLTILILSREVIAKTRDLRDVNPLHFLFSPDQADRKLMQLLEKLNDMLLADNVVTGVKNIIINLLLIFATATDNLDENPFITHLMFEPLVDTLLDFLSTSEARRSSTCLLGYKIIFFMVILTNYRKHTESNLYKMKLSIEDNEVTLAGLAQVMSTSLAEFNGKHHIKLQANAKTGLFSSITNIVGNMFVPDEGLVDRKNNIRSRNAALLAFYEVIHLNRSFISLLTSAEFYEPPNLEDEETADQLDSSINTIVPATNNGDSGLVSCDVPTNLFCSFIEFSSIVMLPSRDETASSSTLKMCLIILQCITEDNCANSIIHDAHLKYRIYIHRVPMRHRKLNEEQPGRPKQLSYYILDLMVEFILTHLRKSLPIDLYQLAIGIIHRVICYQKKFRLDAATEFSWKELWHCLIALLKFILNHETDLCKQAATFLLINQIVNIFNIFITFGDTFLHSDRDYDDLYYEIIRMHTTFENIYSLMLRCSASEMNENKIYAARVMSSMVNIRAINSHFSGKIESWQATHQASSLSEEQVLAIVRQNYDTLKLKLQDSLDQYEPHAPQRSEREGQFLRDLLLDAIKDFRSNTSLSCITAKELTALLTDLQVRSANNKSPPTSAAIIPTPTL